MVPFASARSSSIKSIPAIVNGAMSATLSEITLLESKSVIPLIPALFYGDNLYSIPQDEIDEIISVAPMKEASGRNFIYGTDNPGANFPGTYYPGQNMPYGDVRQHISMEYRGGIQYLKISQPLSSIGPLTISNCDSLTGITASLDANNLALNSIYAQENSAIDFDLGFANLDGKITFAIDSLDISSITRDGTVQASVFVPEALVGKLTNLTMVLADEVGFTNTATMVATSNAFGGPFSYGWQPVRFDYRSKVEAGTFVETAITHFSIDLIHTLTTAVTGVKIDSIKAYKGLGYELNYYNQKHFKSTAGVFLAEASNVSDIVICDKKAAEILVQECRKLIDYELRGTDGGQQYNLAERKLYGVFPNPGLYENYKIDRPSEKLPIISTY